MSMRIKLSVDMEDGSTTTVTAGQRDMAAFEAEPFGCSSMKAVDEKPMMLFRYLAWSALRRAEGLKAKFHDWDLTVEAVEPVEEEDADPTNTAQ